jgi:fatty acyl-CoA reductase
LFGTEQIPADMVVNQMIVAMATHAYQNDLFVYHVASSVANPLPYSVVTDALYSYFSKNPCVSKDGNLIHVKELLCLKSMRSFRLYMFQRYKAPLKVINLSCNPHFLLHLQESFQLQCATFGGGVEKQVFGVVNKVLCCNFTERYKRMLRSYNKAMYLAELYEPYVFFNGRFVSRLILLFNA